MRRRRRHTKQIILLILSIEILAVVGFLAYVQMRPMAVPSVTMEAGSGVPDIKEFLLYKNRKAVFLTDMQGLDLDSPGSYEIKIKIGSRIHTSSLQIIDTTPPTASVTDQIALKGETIEAASFISDIRDASDVTVFYLENPDTMAPGEKEVNLILEDSSKNRTEMKAMLTILDMSSTMTVEAGSGKNAITGNLVNNHQYDINFITDISTLDIGKPAVHDLQINVNGKAVTIKLMVVDTTPPKASFFGHAVWQGDTIDAMSFVTGIVDASPVTAEFKNTPDTSVIGNQVVDILLKDASGNITEQSVAMTVRADTEPPKILGTRDKTVYIGDGIAYRKDVYVTDNKDSDLKVTVDSSAVNLKAAGVYNVIYTAEDKAGNKASVTTTVTVVKLTVSQDMVDELCDKVLKKIITDDMTKLEKADEIYHWIKKSVGYTGDSDKTDWLAEAYRGMEDGEGDCFTYYAVAQALLTRAGIDNMQVTRLGGRTHHYWNLVNCGDGWYHFDSCPHKDHVETFMLTDKELDAFADTRGSYYYNRDKSLYPATPEK